MEAVLFDIKSIYLVISWAIYFFLHSFLASDSVKEYILNKWPSFIESYRLFYTIIAVITLIPVVYSYLSVPKIQILASTNMTRYMSLMLATFGVIVMHLAFKQYELRAFLGFKKETDNTGPMVTGGILSYVRHPIYSGIILLSLGYFLFSGTNAALITILCTFVYLPIGIYLEEAKLIKRFGSKYLEFRKRVPAIFPRLF